MDINSLLKKFGLNDKESKVYLALLEQGPVSVRSLAQSSGVNRGTTYDILKSLKAMGLVSYYHKETKQFFTAEDPETLVDALEEKEQSLFEVKKYIQEAIPALKSLYHKAGSKPVVKYYEGARGIKTILQNVLDVVGVSPDKTYYIFSSSAIRPYLHKAWAAFTAERIRRGIKVDVIAIGHTGAPAALSRRRSFVKEESSPTYVLIYEGRVAMISVNQHRELLGLIIEDDAIFQTQRQLFTFIWQQLKP